MPGRPSLRIFIGISMGLGCLLLFLYSKVVTPRFCMESIKSIFEEGRCQQPTSDSVIKLDEKNLPRQVPVCDNRSLPDVKRLAWSPYHIPVTEPDETSLTVLILSYNRVNFLRKSIKHYARMSVVDKVVILWSNLGSKVPEDLISQYNKSVVVELLPENLLRLRFRPLKFIRTRAVLSLDDDVIIAENNAQHALDVWKNHSYGLVGFVPRRHEGNSKDTIEYGGQGLFPYSLILTGASIIHVNYLQMFTETLPLGIQEMVDKLMNCEDIAMNFMVSHHCKCAGVFYVDAKKGVQLLTKPGKMLHSRPGHYENRSVCLREFLNYYPNLPLQTVRCVY